PGGNSPTATEVAGGTLGATGPQTVPTQANPIAVTGVLAGSYTMNATAPAGYQLVSCGRVPDVDTQSVTVPSGGAGVGVFYAQQNPVAPVTQTIAGHIYSCPGGNSPTATEVAGGTLGATGPQTVPTQANPIAVTGVMAGSYTMNATTPAGYHLVSCGRVPGVTTESVTVPSGGAGVGVFYAQQNPAAPVSQTIAGHIYSCPGGNSPTATEVAGGTLGAT